MLKCVDQIPDRCGDWYTKALSFRDCPDEHFIVHHRNPVEAIKALWGDPAFAEHLVYKPAKLFRGKETTEQYRMFSEMWTGGFWNAVQVCALSRSDLIIRFITYFKLQIILLLGSHSERRHSLPSDYSLTHLLLKYITNARWYNAIQPVLLILLQTTDANQTNLCAHLFGNYQWSP